MARPAPRYYSDSDTDVSSYGYNLTAEEEEEISALIDSISPPTPPTPRPGTCALPQTNATTPRSFAPSRSPLKHSTPVVAADPALDDSSAEDELSDPSFDIRSEIDNAVHRHVAKPDPDERARVIPSFHAPSSDSKSRLAPSVRDDNPRLATFVADSKAKPAHSDPVDSDVRYPDLSGALSGLQRQDEPSGSPSNTLASQAGTPRKSRRPKRSVEEKNLVIEDTRSPILRFRTFPKKPFSVTDLTSGAWCELQYYYVLSKLPGGKKTQTRAMKGGTSIHERLEREIYTPVSVEITKPEDNFGLKIWNIITGLRTLRDTGLTRELEVWGILDDGLVVNGVIDGLSYENPDPTLEEEVLSSRSSQVTDQPLSQQQQPETTDFFPPEVADKREIFITDVKTRGSKKPPTKAAMRVTIIQLFLYHRFLSEMASGKLNYWRVFERYGIDPDEPFSDTFMAQMGALHEEVFSDTTSQPDYVSAASTTSEEAFEAGVSRDVDDDLESTVSSHAFDSLKYRTLRDLVSLLKFELQLTFPRGGASLGQIVAVEFRYRSSHRLRVPNEENEYEEMEDPENGSIICVNTFWVEPETLNMYLQDDLQWWKGERDPRGVPVEESYKCQMCEFAGECDWRMRLEQETMRMAKKKSLARNKNKEASVSW
ncbi:exonuclease V [Copromyces sp. CBS 386.78]|nr:exonuclease V [Copromyces sp. CBS 386.78]